MAPRKRKVEGEDQAVEKNKAKEEMASTMRVTRSSSRRANSNEPPAKLPEKKKSKKKEKAEAKEETPEEVKQETLEEVKPETGTDTKVTAEIAAESETEKTEDVKEAGAKKTIVIEHCKQCNSFKTRAIKVKEGIESARRDITVQLNPEKPRKGCFEIREEGGETFVSLLDMKRPFKPMKDLDMDKVISDIIEKLA